MRNRQNKFRIKMAERIWWIYVHINIIMKVFISETEKLEAFIYSLYNEKWSIPIMESIDFDSPLVTYDIKRLLWHVNAFPKKIGLSLKIEETKSSIISLILINKIKEYKVKLLIVNQLLFFSFGNGL